MKSHVSMEQHCCPVCGKTHDTGSILLNKRLKPTMEQYTITGWGLCPEHKALADDGYIALVECDPHKTVVHNDRSSLDQAYRTGVYAHVRREAFNRIFNVPVAEDQHLVFVEPGVISRLQEMTRPPV